jgi:hypothetical protein
LIPLNEINMFVDWMSLNNFWKRVLKDVHFFTISQQSSLETQPSILRSNVYPPYLDDRLHFYPVYSNLLTTCNKGKTRDHTVIFRVWMITLLFFLLLVVRRNLFWAGVVQDYHLFSTQLPFRPTILSFPFAHNGCA